VGKPSEVQFRRVFALSWSSWLLVPRCSEPATGPSGAIAAGAKRPAHSQRLERAPPPSDPASDADDQASPRQLRWSARSLEPSRNSAHGNRA